MSQTQTAKQKPLNGISWMFTNMCQESTLQAVKRMEQQCPVTQRVRCINVEDPEIDPVLEAWHKAHPAPIPTFTDIVRQQEAAEAS